MLEIDNEVSYFQNEMKIFPSNSSNSHLDSAETVNTLPYNPDPNHPVAVEASGAHQPSYQFSSLHTNQATPYQLSGYSPFPTGTSAPGQEIFESSYLPIQQTREATKSTAYNNNSAGFYNHLKSSSAEKATQPRDDYYLANSLPLSPISFDPSSRSSKVASLSNNFKKQSAKQQLNSQPGRHTNSTPNGKFKPTSYELADFGAKAIDKLANSSGGQMGALNAECMEKIYKKLIKSDPSTRSPFIQVKLETKNLWEEFSSIGTEMIITKCGRFVLISTDLNKTCLPQKMLFFWG